MLIWTGLTLLIAGLTFGIGLMLAGDKSEFYRKAAIANFDKIVETQNRCYKLRDLLLAESQRTEVHKDIEESTRRDLHLLRTSIIDRHSLDELVALEEVAKALALTPTKE